MKKAIAVLLAFALVGVAFAQDEAPAPYFNAAILTGVRVTGTEGADPINLLWGNTGYAGNPSALWFDFGIDAPEWGLYVEVDCDDFLGGADVLYVYNAFGYYNFGEIAKLEVGVIDDTTWQTYYNYYGKWSDAGLVLSIMPMDGLTLGLATNVPAGGYDVTKLSQDLWIMAKYANKDLGLTVVGGYNADGSADSSDLWFGVKYTGMENLLVDFEFKDTNLGNDLSNPMAFVLYGKYTMGDMYFSLAVTDTMDSGTTVTVKDNVLSIAPKFNYTMDIFNLGISGSFTMNTDEVAAQTYNGYSVKPYCNISLGDTTLYTYFKFADTNMSVANNAVWSLGADMSFSF